MNWDTIQGDWKQFKGDVQKQWGKLTNDELDQINGDRTKLEGKIQEKYGKTKNEANAELDKWHQAR